MKRSLFIFLTAAFGPLCLMAQTVTPTPVGPKAIINDSIFKLTPGIESRPVSAIRMKFDIYSFFKGYNSSIFDFEDGSSEKAEEDLSPENAQKAKEDLQKMRALGLTNFPFARPRHPWLGERGPFNFVFSTDSIFLIDPKTPTRAVILEQPEEETFPDVDMEGRKFANEVDPIAVEKMDGSIYRIFEESVGGDEKWGNVFPRIKVFDYNPKNNVVITYNFEAAFAKDLEKKGHRDVVVYDDESGERTTARVFSWNGKGWVDISDKQKLFLDDFVKRGFESF